MSADSKPSILPIIVMVMNPKLRPIPYHVAPAARASNHFAGQ
jgi:hypothetical protein